MNDIRLKSNLKPECLRDRLRYNPSILELHLSERDLIHPIWIMRTIRMLKAKNINVYLHHPTTYHRNYLDIISEKQEIRKFYDRSTDILIDICQQEDVKVVIHAHYNGTESSDLTDPDKTKRFIERVNRFTEKGREYLLWENTTEGIFSLQNERLLEDIVKPLQLSLCFDISHGFIALNGDNEALCKALQQFQPYSKYYHVVDSSGTRHDGLPLGKGKIDWSMVKPFLQGEEFIFEIDLRSSNHKDCRPMIESAIYLRNLQEVTE
jgi:sugar phosphate isomerase/epimerase